MKQFLARMSFAEGQGPQVFDEHRLALRGVLIRHLVMPGLVEETRQILRWIADEVGAHTYVNLMDQYSPAGRVGSSDYPEINRRVTSKEYETALETAFRCRATAPRSSCSPGVSFGLLLIRERNEHQLCAAVIAWCARHCVTKSAGGSTFHPRTTAAASK